MTGNPRPRRYFGPSGPITWPFLDADKETEQLAELTNWVDWLRWRFALDHRTLPDCWAKHGAIVEELSALFTAWQASYAFSNDGGSACRSSGITPRSTNALATKGSSGPTP